MKKQVTRTLAVLMMSTAAFAATPGQKVYNQARCANCHGEKGAADTVMGKKYNIKRFNDPSLAKVTEQEFSDVITNGKDSKMPAYKGTLTTDQIKAVSAYVKALK